MGIDISLTKEEVLHRLKTSGQLQTMDDNELWRAAFRLYNLERGTAFKARDFCQKCYGKVSMWLQGIKE